MSKQDDLIQAGTVFTWLCPNCGRSGVSTFHLNVEMAKVQERIRVVHNTVSPWCKATNVTLSKDAVHSAKPKPVQQDMPKPRAKASGGDDSGEMSEGELAGILG